MAVKKSKNTIYFFEVDAYKLRFSNHMVMRKHIMAAGGERVFHDDDE